MSSGPPGTLVRVHTPPARRRGLAAHDDGDGLGPGGGGGGAVGPETRLTAAEEAAGNIDALRGGRVACRDSLSALVNI